MSTRGTDPASRRPGDGISPSIGRVGLSTAPALPPRHRRRRTNHRYRSSSGRAQWRSTATGAGCGGTAQRAAADMDRGAAWFAPPSAAGTALLVQVVEAGHVLAGDLPAHGGRDLGEVAVESGVRARPDAVGMRVVRAPDDVVLAYQWDDRFEELVLLIGHIALPAEVIARLQFEIKAARPVGIFGVETVEHIGQPSHPGFAEDEIEIGVLVAGARG